MEQGIINQETLAEVLRHVSQRRKQGILKVTTAGCERQFLMHQGRAVEVVISNVPPVREILQQLTETGIVPSSGQLTEIVNYQELLQILDQLENKPSFVNAEYVAFIRKHRLLENLHLLQSLPAAVYCFEQKAFSFERSGAPSISLNQIVLDLLEYSESKSRFEAIFTPELHLLRGEKLATDAQPEEKFIWQVTEHACRLDELKKITFFCTVALQATLLKMFETGSVQLVDQSTVSLKGGLSDGRSNVIADNHAASPQVETGIALNSNALTESDRENILEQSENLRIHNTRSRFKLAWINSQLQQQSLILRGLLNFFFIVALFLAPYTAWRAFFSAFAK